VRGPERPAAEAEHAIELPDPPVVVRAHLAEVADAWGAELTPTEAGGELRLPVVNGLHRGFCAGPLVVVATDEGSRVVFTQAERILVVNRPAAGFLALALAGATLTVLWPFFPKLLPAAPAGAILALAGWFLVVSRLRNSGPREFLETLAVVGAEKRAKSTSVGGASEDGA
jgi:hypothetical protein